jgi:hypothetical protein
MTPTEWGGILLSGGHNEWHMTDSLSDHGFVRVVAAVPHSRVGDPGFNAERTVSLAARADERAAAVVIHRGAIPRRRAQELLPGIRSCR